MTPVMFETLAGVGLNLNMILSSMPKLTSRQAYTMGIAELRRSVEQPGGETVRTVPLLERNDRQRQQATRLSGVETEA